MYCEHHQHNNTRTVTAPATSAKSSSAAIINHFQVAEQKKQKNLATHTQREKMSHELVFR